MTISLQEAPAYLVRRGLIAPRDIVDRRLVLTEIVRRNVSLRVETHGGPRLLLKQAIGPQGEFAVRNEAAVYRWLARPENAAVHHLLPRFVDLDAAENLLIIELLPEAEGLDAYQARRRRMPPSFAADAGRGLAALHGLSLDAGVPGLAHLAGEPAWALSIHRPALPLCQDATPASSELFQIVQRYPEIGEGLESLQAGWRADAFLHNDPKWDNWLLVREAAARKRPQLKLADWEAAGAGDARWDVACVLAGFLETWVRSIPLTEGASIQHLAGLAAYPIERLHPAVTAFMVAYAALRGLTDGPLWLAECVRFSAPRLLEIAYAESQRSEVLSGHALILVQLALNILRRPAQAVGLLGLE